MINIQKRNNVHILGNGPVTLVFVHGFGFDQNVWQYISDEFATRYRLVLLDLTGSGQSDVSGYDFIRHSTLHAHADDLLEVMEQYSGGPAFLIGHSVGSLIGMLASIKAPQHFSAMVMIAASPSLINDGNYVGGFERSDIAALLDTLEINYLGWSGATAPTILGVSDRSEAGRDFANGFCRNDPEIGKHFARVTFLADHREDLKHVTTPTLIIQASDDPFVPSAIGARMQEGIRGSTLAHVKCVGHCPHIVAPRACIEVIDAFLNTLSLRQNEQSKENVSGHSRDA